MAGSATVRSPRRTSPCTRKVGPGEFLTAPVTFRCDRGCADRLTETVSRSPTTAPLAPFSAPTRAWFAETFAAATDAQARGWAAIAAGRDTLIHAPTGSGKTLAAFLWCVDRAADPSTAARAAARVLYISPLKALTYDVERNLRAAAGGHPPHGGARWGRRCPRCGSPRGPATRRPTRGASSSSDPPDILVTTPESPLPAADLPGARDRCAASST